MATSVYCGRRSEPLSRHHRPSSIVQPGAPTMTRAAVLTLSDRSYAGEWDDLSGAIVTALLRDRLGIQEIHSEVLPDEQSLIEDTLRRWADVEGYGLVVTTGGTGISPRDVTPDATM